MLKKINLQDAVGTRLAHDITEIRPGEFKGAAFRKGHTVCNEDICHLQKLGKNHLYVVDPAEDEIHENEAAAILAAALAGENIAWENNPKEGKIGLTAAVDGLLRVNTAALAAFNMVDEVMCATLHSHTLVQKGKLVAATRAIPLVMKRAPIERAAAIARQGGGVVAVRVLRRARAGIVVTGSEVFNGLIQDRFAPILTEKVTALGSEVAGVSLAQTGTRATSFTTCTTKEHRSRFRPMLLPMSGRSMCGHERFSSTPSAPADLPSESSTSWASASSARRTEAGRSPGSTGRSCG